MIPNAPVITVSELSQSLKATIEDKFGYVHVRGELSDVKVAASGHCYARLKDTNAVLDAIIWRTSMGRMAIKPEEGLEVIATGKLTTYPGRSSYQIVIERLEVAGEGALLKLIEDRRKKLAAEGLFDEARKRPIPQFPRRIGVITSPGGAVIRDILHRLAERYPVEVWMWPVLVQGEGAAAQIASAIDSLCRLDPGQRPDVVIVARGGGSLEDLMAFNDESVVRAAANCPVPLISAVGHETDTTLIDYASDKRAPTPTAAAELATPHRASLIAALGDMRMRLLQTLNRQMDDTEQRLDHLHFRLSSLIGQRLEKAATNLAGLRPRSPESIVTLQQQKLDSLSAKMTQSYAQKIDDLAQRVDKLSTGTTHKITQIIAANVTRLARQTLRAPNDIISAQTVRVKGAADQLQRAGQRLIDVKTDRLTNVARMLESVSYKSVLERGFVLVRAADGTPLVRADDLHKNQDVTLHFADEKTRGATITD